MEETRRGFISKMWKTAVATVAGTAFTSACAPETNSQPSTAPDKFDGLKENAGDATHAGEASSPRSRLEVIAGDVSQEKANLLLTSTNKMNHQDSSPADISVSAKPTEEITKREITPEEAKEKERAKFKVKFLSHLPHDYVQLQEFLRKNKGELKALFSERLVPWVYGERIYDKQNLIYTVAGENGLPPNLIAVIMYLESNGLSQNKNPAGPAMGAMQVMPVHFEAKDFPDKLKSSLGDTRFTRALNYMHNYEENLIWNKEQNEWLSKDISMAEDVSLLMKFMRDDWINLRVSARYLKSLFNQINVNPKLATLKDLMKVVPAYHGGDSNLKIGYSEMGKWTRAYADRFAKTTMMVELSYDFNSLGQDNKMLQETVGNLFS